MIQLLAIAMPGPIEMVILLIFGAFALGFVFLLFRLMWRAGSR